MTEAFDISRGLSHGTAALKAALAPLMVGGLIMSCTEGGGGGGGGGNYQMPSGQDFGDLNPDQVMQELGIDLSDPIFITVALVAILVVALVLGGMFLLRSWIHPGYIRLQRAVLTDGRGDLSHLLSGGDLLWKIAGWKLVKTLVGMGVFTVAGLPGIALMVMGFLPDTTNVPMVVGGLALMMLLALPVGLYVGLGLSMGELAITLEGRGVMDALDRSWSLADGRRFSLFVFLLVFGFCQVVATFLGICLFCVGWFVTVPAMRAISDSAFTEAFLILTRDQEETRGWAIWKMV